MSKTLRVRKICVIVSDDDEIHTIQRAGARMLYDNNIDLLKVLRSLLKPLT